MDASVSAKRGRKKATGRFETRADLCEAVWADWLRTKRSVYQIAKSWGVSAGVVNSIIDNHEGKPTDGG